jgi:Tol biopolymer transport system component
VVDYRYPYPTETGSTVVLKKSNKKAPAFYLINQDGKEQKIANKFISIDDQFSYNKGKIIYAAYEPDKRWGNRAFNQLAVLDLATGETEIVAKHTKYYSPDISHDGKQILVVENANNGESSLKLLNEKANLKIRDGFFQILNFHQTTKPFL